MRVKNVDKEKKLSLQTIPRKIPKKPILEKYVTQNERKEQSLTGIARWQSYCPTDHKICKYLFQK